MPNEQSAYIIVVGNEKGGSGKTTTAMHLAISLLKLEFKVATIDLDCRQQSFTNYIKNRTQTIKAFNIPLMMPDHYTFSLSNNDSKSSSKKDDETAFAALINKMKYEYDFIVIDTPGSDTDVSRFAHSFADTVITPVNDSFVDLLLLGEVDAQNFQHKASGIYSAGLWAQKQTKLARQEGELKWVVVRNRLSSLDNKNKRNVEQALQQLAKRLGFKVIQGFYDRVIYKELFLEGLTLHDSEYTDKIRMTTSVLAARQELRDFLLALDIKKLTSKIAV